MITQSQKTGDLVLAELVDEITRRLQDGQPVDMDELGLEHPELADRLRELLPTLQLLNQLQQDSQASDAHPASNGDRHASAPNNGMAADTLTDRTLGDFRLGHEIGRGGMGVVYEAEQISLGRTVALKVLPFASMLDSRQLNRFRNEARAAASLHHTNIVPVHFVGCERSVHFYAMQYIKGESLARVIEQLRGDAGLPDVADQKSEVGSVLLTLRREDPASRRSVMPTLEERNCDSSPTTDWTPQYSPTPDSRSPTSDSRPPTSDLRRLTPAGSPLTSDLRLPTSDTVAHAFLSTARSTSSKTYFRAIAELGIQAAEALDYAHEQGVIHRDIKPANLLLDESGRLWITDFGLARLESDAGMTMTGDLVGTLRYMSPEQALAKRVVVDHRTDIYSLGVTLYELLALRAAFDGDDRQHLLKQIAFDDPPPLHKFNRQIPVELETIVFKAIRKNPAERYATTRDFAEDLRSFLQNKPIKAKPPTRREQLSKWSRRHPAGVRATLIAFLIIIIAVATAVGWVARDHAARETMLSQQISQALMESAISYESGKLTEAISALKRAEGLLASGGASDEIKQRVEGWRSDLETVERLERIRMDQAGRSILSQPEQTEAPAFLPAIALWGPGIRSSDSSDTTSIQQSQSQSRVWNRETADRAYQQEFQKYGINSGTLDNDKAAQLIRNSPIKQALVAALDDWFHATQSDKKTSSGRTALLQIAQLADPDPWRDRLRDAIGRNDDAALAKLATESDSIEQPLPTVLLLVRALEARDPRGVSSEGATILRQVQRRHANDFWTNEALANCLPNSQIGDEVGFRRVAVALRPESVGAQMALAERLHDQGNDAEAEAVCREATRLNPGDSRAFVQLAEILEAEGKEAAAEAAWRDLIRLSPDNPKWSDRLYQLLLKQRKYAEALPELLRVLAAESKTTGVSWNHFIASMEALRSLVVEGKTPPDELAADFACVMDLTADNRERWSARTEFCR